MQEKSITKEVKSSIIRLIFALIFASMVAAAGAYVKTEINAVETKNNKELILEIRSDVKAVRNHLMGEL